MRNIKTILIISILLTIFVFLFFYNRYNKSYTKVSVQRGDITKEISVPGKVKAEKDANLRFDSIGKVSKLNVSENDFVKKGDVLAVLDQAFYNNDVSTARSYVSEAEDEINKFIDTYRKDLGEPEIIYQRKQLEERLKQAKLVLKNMLKKKSNSVLIAPFDGVVVDVNTSVGEVVNPLDMTPVIKVADLSTIYFEAEVDQEDSSDIKPGQKAGVNLDAFKDKEFIGEVFNVSKFTTNTKENDSVVKVKIKFLGDVSNLKLGLEGDSQIEIETKKNVLLVPKDSVFNDAQGRYVYLWNRNKLIKKSVKTGIFNGVNWEILDGLDDSSIVAEKQR